MTFVKLEKVLAIVEKNAEGMSWSENPRESGAGFELLKRAQALRSLPTDDGVTDMIAHIRKQAQRQDVRLAALDAVPMSEPKQLNASHWGRESVINDEQCLQIFEAMLDAIAALGPLPAPPAIEGDKS